MHGLWELANSASHILGERERKKGNWKLQTHGKQTRSQAKRTDLWPQLCKFRSHLMPERYENPKRFAIVVDVTRAYGMFYCESGVYH